MRNIGFWNSLISSFTHDIFRKQLYNETLANLYNVRQNVAKSIATLNDKTASNRGIWNTEIKAPLFTSTTDINEKVLSEIKAVERKEIQEENSKLSKLVKMFTATALPI